MRSFIQINQKDFRTIVNITEGEHEHVDRQRSINDQTRVAIDKLSNQVLQNQRDLLMVCSI